MFEPHTIHMTYLHNTCFQPSSHTVAWCVAHPFSIKQKVIPCAQHTEQIHGKHFVIFFSFFFFTSFFHFFFHFFILSFFFTIFLLSFFVLSFFLSEEQEMMQQSKEPSVTVTPANTDRLRGSLPLLSVFFVFFSFFHFVFFSFFHFFHFFILSFFIFSNQLKVFN